jgi:phosphoribosyl-AMP cyclohydrolase
MEEIDKAPSLDEIFDSSESLLPVVTQDHLSGEVLMLAYVNRAALEMTIKDGFATYWSRSRKELWQKGARSGNHQLIKSVTLDCDGDAFLYRVEQKGVACHTGERTCFHRLLH